MANTHSIDLEASSSQALGIVDGSQTGLELSTDFTIEGWIKLESLGATQVMVAKWNANVGPPQQISYLVYLDTNNKLNLYFSSDGSAFSSFITDAAFVSSTGVWTHFAVSVDISVPSVEIYKDGVLVADTASTTASTTIFNSTATFLIGCNESASVATNFFDGKIDDIRVWNDIRTAVEIASNKDKQLVGNESNLVGYWKLNNDYLDETSNNNDLSSVGGPVFSTDVPFTEAGFLGLL